MDGTDGVFTATENSAEISRNTTIVLPAFPGEEVLAHEGVVWIEQAEARFGILLAVAQGQPPARTQRIVDIDLTSLPMLPVGNPGYDRRLEIRTRYLAQNEANVRTRFDMTMADWTTIYSALKVSTETTAPMLSREMKEICDLQKTQGLPGGYFDGPRAWTLTLDTIHGGVRSESDKD